MIYVLRMRADQQSAGASFHGSRRAAERAAAAYRRASHPDDSPETEIEALPTPKNKRELLHLLWQVGSHPDNG